MPPHVVTSDHCGHLSEIEIEHETRNSQLNVWGILAGTAVLLMAAAAAKHVHYLLFHTMAELIAITVSFSIFTLTWASQKLLKNSYLTILGAAYGTTGIVDVFHALTFQGMNLFPAVTTNHPTQFWLTARFIESVALILAPLLLRRAANFRLASGVFAALGAVGVILIWLGALPATFVDGVGLTPFKIGSEYVIIVMLLIGLALLWRNRHDFSRNVFCLVSASALLAIATEVCFTQYVNFYDFSNELGHYFRLVSVLLAYRAIVVTGVQRPAEILFRQVVTHELELTATNIRLEQSENRLNQAQALANIGSWHLNMASGKLTCSDEACRIFGLAIGTPLTPAILGASIHPEDRAIPTGRDAMAGTLYDAEYRIVADGQIKWVRERVELQFAPDGSPLAEMGTVQDITARKLAEQSVTRLNELLIVSERRARELVELSSDWSWEQDEQFRFTSLSTAAPAVILGTTRWAQSARPDASEWPQHRALLEAHQPYRDFEYESLSDDGRSRWISSSGRPQFDASGRFKGYLGSSKDITDRKQAETLRHSEATLRDLTSHQEIVREGERKRIARDIHDDLGQNLLVLKMDVATLHARTGSTHPKLNKRVALVLNNINAAVKSVKAIINDLRPATLELGLYPAVEWQIREFERVSGITCTLTAIGETGFGQDADRISALFRIFKEALTNVVRHAQASEVEVTLCQDERGFSMKIKDNGKGFVPGERKKNSFGLVGIKERIKSMGGELTIESTPNHGTTLSILIGRSPPHSEKIVGIEKT